MTIVNGFLIVFMFFLFVYSFCRLIRKKSLLMVIPVCMQIFSIILAVMAFVDNVEVLPTVEAIYLAFGIIPAVLMIFIDYGRMVKKIKTQGYFDGFIEKAEMNIQPVLSLPPEGINTLAKEKQAAEIIEDLPDLPEELRHNIKKCLNYAHTLISRKNHIGAFYIYDTLSKVAGTSYMLYYNLAGVCHCLGKYEEAIQACKKSLELLNGKIPGRQDVYYNMANAYYMLRRYDRAAKNYENALELDPDNIQAIENLSFTYVKMGQTGKGIETLRKLSAEEGHYRTHYIWGALLHDAGEYKQAEEQLRKSVLLNPDSIEARDELGKVLIRLDKFEEAIDVFNDILKIDADNYPAWYNKANALMKQNRWKEAVFSYKEAIGIKPDCYKSYYNMAVALEENGDKNEAIDAYRSAIEINADFTDAYNNLGILLSLSGHTDEALDVYKQGILKNRNEFSLYFNMGMCLFDECRYVEAAAAYRNAIDINPDELGIYYYLGAALTEMRHYNDAIEAYKSALEIKPSDGELYYNLAAIYALLGRYDISADNLERAVRLNPDICGDVNKNSAFDGMRGRSEFKQLIS